MMMTTGRKTLHDEIALVKYTHWSVRGLLVPVSHAVDNVCLICAWKVYHSEIARLMELNRIIADEEKSGETY